MKIKEIINKNFCVDSRLLKRNDVFFDFLSNSKKINPFLKSVIKKKPSLIFSPIKINYRNSIIPKNTRSLYLSLIKKNIKKYLKIFLL